MIRLKPTTMTRLLVAFVLAVTCLSTLLAEPQSTISGRITDSESGSIAKVHVFIHSDPSGKNGYVGEPGDVNVLTDKSGDYSATLPAGFYDVFVSAPAFTPKAAKVIVRPGQRATLDVRLMLDPLVSKEIGGMEVSGASK